MSQERIRIAIAGWGNIGRAALEAALEASDMEVAGVIRREACPVGFDVPVETSVDKLGHVDVVALALPSRLVGDAAQRYLEKGISTVDSFDIHTEIAKLRERLHTVAVAHGSRSVISAGWDPGSDSIVRALLLAAAPKGITYTNFGPGMSMGHSVAVKAIEGVADALSMTIPTGEGIHRRMVYVQLEESADFASIQKAIQNDPYFLNDETLVQQVGSVDALKDMGHGVHLVRKGVSGQTQNQNFAFSMSINNPALTGQILVSAARAALRQNPGCYTMIELPVVDFLPGERDHWVHALV